MSQKELAHRLLRDIALGYSHGTHYYRHETPIERSSREALYSEKLDLVKAKGVPEEKEMLAMTIENDLWSDEREKSIKYESDFLNRLYKSRRFLLDKRQVEASDNQIAEHRGKLMEALEARREAFGPTAENIARRMSYDIFVAKRIFSDEGLTDLVFPDPGSATGDDLDWAIADYQTVISEFSEENIKHSALLPDIQLILSESTEILGFFNSGPAINNTVFQVRLFRLAKYYKYLMSKLHENAPDEAYSNPDLLEKMTTDKNRAEPEKPQKAETIKKSLKDKKEVTGEDAMKFFKK